MAERIPAVSQVPARLSWAVDVFGVEPDDRIRGLRVEDLLRTALPASRGLCVVVAPSP